MFLSLVFVVFHIIFGIILLSIILSSRLFGILFIDRDYEMDFLEPKFDSDRTELVIIYSLRGVGKTELIKRLIQDRSNAFYFYVSSEEPKTFCYVVFCVMLSKVLETIRENIDLWVSRKFETVTKQFFERINGSKLKGTKVSFTEIGRWWKKETEIDIVAIDKNRDVAYFIECKYTKKPPS